MYGSSGNKGFIDDFEGKSHVSNNARNDLPFIMESSLFTERNKPWDRENPISQNYGELIYMDRKTAATRRSVPEQYSQQGESHHTRKSPFRDHVTPYRECDRNRYTQKCYEIVATNDNLYRKRCYNRENGNRISSHPLLFSFEHENSTSDHPKPRRSIESRPRYPSQSYDRYNSYKHSYPQCLRIESAFQSGIHRDSKNKKVKDSFELKENFRDVHSSQQSSSLIENNLICEQLNPKVQSQMHRSKRQRQQEVELLDYTRKKVAEPPLYEHAKLLAEMSALAHNEVKQSKEEASRKARFEQDYIKKQSHRQEYSYIKEPYFFEEKNITQAKIISPKSTTCNYGSPREHNSPSLYTVPPEKGRNLITRFDDRVKGEKYEKPPPYLSQSHQFESRQTNSFSSEHYRRYDDRSYPTLYSSKSFDEYNLRGREYNKGGFPAKNDDMNYSSQLHLSSRNYFTDKKSNDYSIEYSQSFPPAKPLPVLPKLSDLSDRGRDSAFSRHHQGVINITDNYSSFDHMRNQVIPANNSQMEKWKNESYSKRLQENDYLHRVNMTANFEDDSEMRTRSMDRGRIPLPKSRARTIKAVLRKKFTWKHYPELEAFLIQNREEYLRHSALNYTAQQKKYNNSLTERILKLAEQLGYVFDEDAFDFVTVRDRIRCYYKSYVQSSKKRGTFVGYGSSKS